MYAEKCYEIYHHLYDHQDLEGLEVKIFLRPFWFMRFKVTPSNQFIKINDFRKQDANSH